MPYRSASVEETAGIVCGACDLLVPLDGAWCPACGNKLSFSAAEPGSIEAAASRPDPGSAAAGVGAVPVPSAPVAATGLAGVPTRSTDSAPRAPVVTTPASAKQEDPVEQNRHYVCKECSSPVPPGHKFCGGCGTTVPPEVLERRVDYFGSMQAPGKARLILIRGTDGTDGLSYLLQGTEHVAGRTSAQIPFPNDPWISDRHANFIYRGQGGDKLHIRDEGSLNGVYVRVKGSVALSPGDQFLCGEQVFRVEATPRDTSGPDPDQTYFYSSPKRTSPFRIVQVLRGGSDGMVHCARESYVHIGREDCEMNFPDDLYLSSRHARIEMSEGGYTLHDVGSRNGIYVRIRGEKELGHGDYLFLGQQLLRVEQTV